MYVHVYNTVQLHNTCISTTQKFKVQFAVFEPAEGGENFDPCPLYHPRSLDDPDCSSSVRSALLGVRDTGKGAPPCWKRSVVQGRDLKNAGWVDVVSIPRGGPPLVVAWVRRSVDRGAIGQWCSWAYRGISVDCGMGNEESGRGVNQQWWMVVGGRKGLKELCGLACGEAKMWKVEDDHILRGLVKKLPIFRYLSWVRRRLQLDLKCHLRCSEQSRCVEWSREGG